MCHREEVQNQIRNNLDRKLETVPIFIRRFFKMQKSSKTSNCVFGYIVNMLQWLIDNNRINEKKVLDITKEDMKNVTGLDLMDYFDDLLEGKTVRKNSIESLHTKINVFHSFWNYLYKLVKCVDSNIVSDILENTNIYKPENTNKKPLIPTYQELKKFLDNLDNREENFNSMRDKTMISLLLGSGIRSDELIGLDITDVFLEENPYIHIVGKGNRKRNVKIIESSANKLREYIQDRSSFLDGFETKSLFVSNRKNRISKTAFKNIFLKYSNGEIYPHELRHYVGSVIANEKNLGVLVAKEQLGHSSLDTTDKYYLKVIESIDPITRKYMKEWRICYGR